jgi:predicted O-linked N-acetylglucosamine transferase (SPINDLY family)
MNKIYLVFPQINREYNNIINFYFRNFNYEIIFCNQLNNIKGDIILFKESYYPFINFEAKLVDIIKLTKTVFLSEDNNIIFVPKDKWSFVNQLEIDALYQDSDKQLIFDTTKEFNPLLHEKYKKIGESYNYLYNIVIKNKQDFINIYNKNLSIKSINDFLGIENIKNNFLLVVYFINKNNLDIIPTILKNSYPYSRFLLVFEDKMYDYDKAINTMVSVLLKNKKYVMLTTINRIYNIIVNIGLSIETIIFANKELELEIVNKELDKNKIQFNDNFISIPLNVFITNPFYLSKKYPIRNINEFINILCWFIYDKFKNKYLIDGKYNDKFKLMTNCNKYKLESIPLHYSITEKALMSVKDYEALLALINSKIIRNYDSKKHNELLVKKITISILTEKENTLETSLVSILTGFSDINLLETLGLLIERTKFSQIKSAIWTKILTKIEDDTDKKIMVLTKCIFNEHTKDNFIILCDHLINDTDLINYIILKNIKHKLIVPLLNIANQHNNDEKLIEKISTIFDKLYPSNSLCNIDNLFKYNFEKPYDLVFNNFIISNAVKFSPYYKSYQVFMENRKRIKNNLIEIIDKVKFKTDLKNIIWFKVGNFELSYQGIPSSDIFKLKCKLIRKICPDLNFKIDTNFKNPKIKVWFHASQLNRQHSVYKDRHQVIKGLSEDPRFDVHFSTFDKLDDSVKYTFGNAKHIILTRNLEDIRNKLSKEKIDIMVYCEIGMDATSYFMACMKLAKIQCNTWGHSDTSGIDTVDYYFSSKLYELPYEKSQTHYSEKLILQNSLCTSYVNPASRHNLSLFKSRSHFGLTKDCVVYFCAQSLFKLNPVYDEYIIDILKNVKNAVLILMEGDNKNTIIERFDYAGIGHKIKFVPGMQHFGYMNLINISDVFLDVYPFGGCNSSFEAFSLGKVVVTQPSEMINGRFTTGFYKKMGLNEMICHNKKDYINFAIRLGNDVNFRKKNEEKIKTKASQLFLDKETIEEWKDDLIKIYNNFNHS